MSFAKVYSAQNSLLKSHIINIEIDLSRGLHSFTIVGLPDKAVEESRDRVSAAIKNSGFKSPKNKNQKVVISLAPANIKKEGSVHELGMALGYLLASKDISFNPEKKMFLGELSLNGEVRKTNGILPLVKLAEDKGFEEVFVPSENANEASLISGIRIYAVNNLREVIDHLNAKKIDGKETERKYLTPLNTSKIDYTPKETVIDFSEIKGQSSAKRGLEIAAAGAHNIALFGPPGTGKTMLAKAFAYILPELSFDEVLEVTGIHSIAGLIGEKLVTHPPFRSPHHTASYVSLVGGGAIPKPGEVTLAHRGVLFLDEFPEFDRRVIDSLRQPLEDRVVSISRARGSAYFPANFILISALNPCPCGNYGIKGKDCTCAPIQIDRYRRKISGPIVDRIDMWIEVSNINHEELSKKTNNANQSDILRERVKKARNTQKNRFSNISRLIKTNSEMSAKDIENLIDLDQKSKELLLISAKKLDLSARAYHKVIRLARTIADLDGSDDVSQNHILEALQYRPKNISLV